MLNELTAESQRTRSYAEKSSTALFALSSATQRHLDKSHYQYPDQSGGESGDDVGGMVYAEIDPRQTDQHERRSTDDPNQNSGSFALDPRGDNRCERAKETGACERVTAGKAVRFRG